MPLAGNPFFSSSQSPGSTNAPLREFENVVACFEQHPGYSRIAWNTGSVGGTLTNAVSQIWAVYRSVSSSLPFDVFFKATPNNTYYNDGLEKTTQIPSFGSGLGVSFCFHQSGEAWNGTTNNDGTDYWTGGRIWKSGSMPLGARQNYYTGSTELFQNTILGMDASTPAVNTGVSASYYLDNENFIFYRDAQTSLANNGCNGFVVFARYVSNRSDIDVPWVLFQGVTVGSANSYFRPSQQYGKLTNASSGEDGTIGYSYNKTISSPSFYLRCLNSWRRGSSMIRTLTGSNNNSRFVLYPTEFWVDDAEHGWQYMGFVDIIGSANIAGLPKRTQVIGPNGQGVMFHTGSDYYASDQNIMNFWFPWTGSITFPDSPQLNAETDLVVLTGSGNASAITIEGLSFNTSVVEILVAAEPVPIYKGFSAGNWVYSVGSPPIGATFISIVGYQ